MVKDKKGNSLKAGDIVVLTARITAVGFTTGENTSNVSLAPITGNDAGTVISINSRFLEGVKSPKATAEPVEPTPGATPERVPNLETGVNETPKPGDPTPGVPPVMSPAKGENEGFREPSSSIGDGVFTSNQLVPDETLPKGERDVKAHGGAGDPVFNEGAEQIRQEPDGRKVDVARDISTATNIRVMEEKGTDTIEGADTETTKASERSRSIGPDGGGEPIEKELAKEAPKEPSKEDSTEPTKTSKTPEKPTTPPKKK